MKKSILVAAVLAFAAPVAMARSLMQTAPQLFMADSEVLFAIGKAKSDGLEVAAAPEEALLAGGCGFAGCDYQSLVTLTVSTKGSNTQTKVIAAIVSTGTNPSVKVIDAEKVMELAR